jgi:hypothetical protein
VGHWSSSAVTFTRFTPHEGRSDSNPVGMKGTFTPTYGVKVPFMSTRMEVCAPSPNTGHTAQARKDTATLREPGKHERRAPTRTRQA